MGPGDRSTLRDILMSLCLSLVFLFPCLSGIEMARATQELSTKDAADSFGDRDLSQSMDKTLKAEEENVRRLKEQLNQVQGLKETVDRELDAYKLQMSVHGNLLLVSTSEVSELERARADHELALEGIAMRLKTLRDQREGIDELRTQAKEKYGINKKELSEIRTEKPTTALEKTRLRQLETLVQSISDQRKTIDQILAVYTKRITQLEETQQALNTLTGRFAEGIRSRKKQDLFKRKESPLASLGWKSISKELRQLATQVSLVFTPDFWLKATRPIRTSRGLS